MILRIFCLINRRDWRSWQIYLHIPGRNGVGRQIHPTERSSFLIRFGWEQQSADSTRTPVGSHLIKNSLYSVKIVFPKHFGCGEINCNYNFILNSNLFRNLLQRHRSLKFKETRFQNLIIAGRLVWVGASTLSAGAAAPSCRARTAQRGTGSLYSHGIGSLLLCEWRKSSLSGY